METFKTSKHLLAMVCAGLMLSSTSSVAEETALAIPGGKRILWCPTSKALSAVAREYNAKDFEAGRVNEAKVKSIVRGCGVSNELFLMGTKPKLDRKRAVTKDGQKMYVIKGAGGRRIIQMN